MLGLRPWEACLFVIGKGGGVEGDGVDGVRKKEQEEWGKLWSLELCQNFMSKVRPLSQTTPNMEMFQWIKVIATKPQDLSSSQDVI